jgi:SAF domain
MPPRLPARRNPRWIALGLIAVCLGGLLSWLVYADLAQQTSVLTMTRAVHRGETIKASDLAAVSMSRSTVLSSVPAADLPELVGKSALVDLAEGALLPRGAIGTMTFPARGRAVVGLQLSYGRVPAGLLPPSTPVRLVTLPAAEGQADGQRAGEQTAPPATFFGRVVDYTDATDGASVLLNVDVAADDAPRISLLGATDRLAVLRDAD